LVLEEKLGLSRHKRSFRLVWPGEAAGLARHIALRGGLSGHVDSQRPSKDLLKGLQMFLHAPHLDLTVMWCDNVQRHVVSIHSTQVGMLDESRVATVEVFG